MELFRLFGTIALDNAKANQGIDETTGKGEKAQSRLSGAFSKIGSAAAVCGKAVAAGMVAAGAAIVKIGKDAVASYADYEQLVGGVETLFKDSAKTVQQYAQNAYKTAGLSANEYMETVTSFSASLLQSLDGDTKKAAESANLAITDMSDNANKMGSSMESIQNAYNGFAKQNYTMLDNLKLGYGGTKQEMERLLKDAEKLSGQKFDLSSYADIVEAIHVVQTEIGITGTTAKEAATTIQGSVASMKGAWQNLLTGMADENQNLDALFKQFVDSVVTVGDNLIPRIQTLLPRIVTGISQLAGSLSAQLPSIMESVLPSLITGAVNIVAAFIKQLPPLVKSIVKSLISTIQSYWSTIQEKGSELLQKLLSGIEKNLPKVVSNAAEIITKLVQGISKNLPKIIDVAGKIIVSLTNGIIASLPSLAAKMPTVIASIAKGLLSSLGSIVNVGVNIVKGLWQGIGSAKDWVISKVKGFGSDILDSLKSIFQIHSPSKATEDDGKMLAMGLAEGIKKNKKYAKKSASEMAELVLSEAKRKLEGLQLYNKISLAGEVEYWNEIRKEFKKGSDERREADKAYYEARKSLKEQAKEQEKAIEDKKLADAEKALTKEKRIRDVSAAEEASYWAEIVAQTKKGSDARIAAEEKYYSALETYKQQYESYVNSIMNQTSLFEAFTMKIDEENPVTGQGLINNLQTQVTGLESYYSTMESLQSKIGGTALMEKLQEMGTDSLVELQAINNMTDEQLQQYVSLYDQKYELAKQKATEKLGDIEETVKKTTENGKKQTSSALQKMANFFKTYTATMASTTSAKFGSIYSSIQSNMAASVTAVKSAVAEMNAALASAPTGGTVSVSSGKVAKHASGGILTKPTIFGYTPSTGTYHLGGEAGKEAIAPIDTLQQYVRSAVAEGMNGGNDNVVNLLEQMVELLARNSNVKLEISGREFGRMVKEYA